MANGQIIWKSYSKVLDFKQDVPPHCYIEHLTINSQKSKYLEVFDLVNYEGMCFELSLNKKSVTELSLFSLGSIGEVNLANEAAGSK